VALALPAPPRSETVLIDGPGTVRAEDEQRVGVVAGLPAHHFSARNPVAEA